MKIRLIGDVHGHVKKYKNLLKDVAYSVQLGDVGFKENYQYLNYYISATKHKFVPGNHDDYDHLPDHALGDYGIYQPENAPALKTKIFFIRGAKSVDAAMRTLGETYWKNEELSYAQGNDCVDLYRQVKPDVVFSHDCPMELLSKFITNDMKSKGSRTNQILQACFNIHQPKHWFFGHHHNTKTVKYAKTKFHCLGELDFIDLNVR